MQPSMKFKDPAQANELATLAAVVCCRRARRSILCFNLCRVLASDVGGKGNMVQLTNQPTNQLLLWYNFNLILSWSHLRNHCRVRQWGKCRSRNLSVESASNEGRSGYSRPLCPGGAPRGCDRGELSQEPEEFDRGKNGFGFLLNYLPGQIGPLLRILWEGHVHWCSQTGPEKEASFNFQLLKE